MILAILDVGLLEVLFPTTPERVSFVLKFLKFFDYGTHFILVGTSGQQTMEHVDLSIIELRKILLDVEVVLVQRSGRKEQPVELVRIRFVKCRLSLSF